MTTMQRSPETALLLHPAGAGSTARSGMILNSVVPALQAEADTLKAGLDEIATVRALETSAANTLAQGLGQVQEARRLLASAVTDRSSLPVRFGDDPEELRVLVQSADTLDAFADGIVGMEQDVGAPMADFEAAQGSLALPVIGTVLLGGLAAKTLTGSAESARRLRGRWRSAIVPGLEAPVPALPMLPLDQVARSPALKQATWADLLTLRQALDTDQ